MSKLDVADGAQTTVVLSDYQARHLFRFETESLLLWQTIFPPRSLDTSQCLARGLRNALESLTKSPAFCDEFRAASPEARWE